MSSFAEVGKADSTANLPVNLLQCPFFVFLGIFSYVLKIQVNRLRIVTQSYQKGMQRHNVKIFLDGQVDNLVQIKWIRLVPA